MDLNGLLGFKGPTHLISTQAQPFDSQAQALLTYLLLQTRLQKSNSFERDLNVLHSSLYLPRKIPLELSMHILESNSIITFFS